MKTNMPDSAMPKSNTIDQSALKEQMKQGSLTTMRSGKSGKGSNPNGK